MSARGSFRRSAAFVAMAALVGSIGSASAGPAPRPAVPRPATPSPDVAERMRAGRVALSRAAMPAPRLHAKEADSRTHAVADGLRAAMARVLDAKPGRRASVPPRPRNAVPSLATRLVEADGETVEVTRAPGDGTPRQVRGRRLGRAAETGGTRIERDTATARRFLRDRRRLLRIADPDAELRVERAEIDGLGCCQLRFAQTWRGLDVWPARMVVQVGEGGDVDSLSGACAPTPRRLVTRPSVSAEAAVRRARGEVPGGAAADVAQPQLVVDAMNPSLPRLAWKLDVAVSVAERWLVLVDAHTGRVLTKFDQVAHEDVAGSGVDLTGTTRQIHVWREGSTYFTVDTSKPMFDPTSQPPNPDRTRGGIVVLDARNAGPDPFPRVFDVTSANPASWSLRDAVSASFGLSKTYDYFKARHGRDSIDGQGGTLYGVVRMGHDFGNAFWNGQLGVMAFGDALPFAASVDVAAHELTHGVTERTAGLLYQNQSGALNEAMSDVFGEMVESFVTGGGNDWRMGTELPFVIRDLRDPSSIEYAPGTPNPSRMSQFIETTQDNGGVHGNSSIVNHAYYLLAEGLPNAVGRSDAERIFFRTLTTKLVPQSRFIDCRLGAIASADELFGQGSTRSQAVADAFDAVEVFAADATPAPAPAPAIDSADATLCLYQDSGAGELLLARRETDLGDSAPGTTLSAHAASLSRPSVSGDGSIAVFVDAASDVCFVRTDGADTASCLGVPGSVHSVAMSPDLATFAFVLRDAAGDPLDSITVVDRASGADRTFPLVAPLLDGGTARVVQADAMTFTRAGDALVYDAFNVLTFGDGTEVGLWSVYALDLATETVSMLIEPTVGFDIGNPSFAHTTDRFLAFEAIDAAANESTSLVLDLFSGAVQPVVTVPQPVLTATPSFSGDDLALIVTAPDATTTGASLFRQDLEADHLTAKGSPFPWLTDGAFGVVYRRGDLPAPPPPASFELTLATGAPKIDALALDVTVGGNSVPIRLVLAHAANGAFVNGGDCTVGGDAVAASGRLTFLRATGSFGYALTLRSASPAIKVQVTGDLGAGTARVAFRGPQGAAKATGVAVTASGFDPTSRIVLSPTVDFRGRLHGTATILGGFGNDLATTGVVTGRVKANSLSLTVADPVAGRRLVFKGVRQGTDFVGRMTFRIPPVSGVAPGYVVPDLFGF